MVGDDTEFVCKDPRGIVISCPKTSWQYLVKHAEMIGQQGVVRVVAEKPDEIRQSVNFEDRHTYYKRLVLASVGDTYLRVVVKLSGTQNEWGKGYIINAFASNGPQVGEKLLWKKENEVKK